MVVIGFLGAFVRWLERRGVVAKAGPGWQRRAVGRGGGVRMRGMGFGVAALVCIPLMVKAAERRPTGSAAPGGQVGKPGAQGCGGSGCARVADPSGG